MGFFKTISTVVVVSASLLYEATDAGVQVLDDTGASVPVDAWSCTPGESPDSWIIELNELWNPWGNTWFRIMVDPGEDIEQLLAVDGPPRDHRRRSLSVAGSPVRCPPHTADGDCRSHSSSVERRGVPGSKSSRSTSSMSAVMWWSDHRHQFNQRPAWHTSNGCCRRYPR